MLFSIIPVLLFPHEEVLIKAYLLDQQLLHLSIGFPISWPLNWRALCSYIAPFPIASLILKLTMTNWVSCLHVHLQTPHMIKCWWARPHFIQSPRVLTWPSPFTRNLSITFVPSACKYRVVSHPNLWHCDDPPSDPISGDPVRGTIKWRDGRRSKAPPSGWYL